MWESGKISAAAMNGSSAPDDVTAWDMGRPFDPAVGAIEGRGKNGFAVERMPDV
jgi:hypothetical protein